MAPIVPQVKTLKLTSGPTIFYRTAGSPTSTPFVLLHGYPSSSHQYRNLIPILAEKYWVIAPDLPSFGFTTVPEDIKYEYTFDSFAKTIREFLDALKVDKFVVYVFDYGAPTGYRLALQKPESILAIITQNGNAYEEGLGGVWGQLKTYWDSPTKENREAIRWLASFDATKWQYEAGSPNSSGVPPETYNLDFALTFSTPAKIETQLDIFQNYQTNVALYPAFHQYFRDHNPPILAVWGKNDEIFVPAGAEAFKKDSQKAEVVLVDDGHFALEGQLETISSEILKFLGKYGI